MWIATYPVTRTSRASKKSRLKKKNQMTSTTITIAQAGVCVVVAV
jgi:hypothetical protein